MAVSCASALLLVAVGVKVAELVAVNRGLEAALSPAAEPRQELLGSIESDGDRHWIDVQGPSESRVLVVIGDRPHQVLTLDRDGHARSAEIDPETLDGSIRLHRLADGELELDASAIAGPARTRRMNDAVAPEAARTPTRSPVVAQARPTATPVPRADHGPTPGASPPLLQMVQDAGPRVALTFDGNASTNRTTELLDLLHRNDLEVTLFVTGKFIEKYPSMIRLAVLAGHEVGNHTYSHPHLTTYERNRKHQLLPRVTKSWFQTELRKTENAFRKATGRPMQPLWRAPFGEENRTLRGWALEMGYLHVRWSLLEGASLDSRDWVADEHSSMYQSSEKIMERLLRFPQLGGGIILMHMATERVEPPWAELPTFLEALEARGMEATTITRLLEESPTWRPWLRRAERRHREVFESEN
jgi:peptidoglycan/xylan/chitin deacetylase (PgdA/CDA1 family)